LQWTVDNKEICIREYQQIVEEFHLFSHHEEVTYLLADFEALQEKLNKEREEHAITSRMLKEAQEEIARGAEEDMMIFLEALQKELLPAVENYKPSPHLSPTPSRQRQIEELRVQLSELTASHDILDQNMEEI